LQRLQFESSPLYLLICFAVGLGYAALLYHRKHSWSVTTNWILFSIRAFLVTLLSVLLLSPIMKFTNNIIEKPAVVFLVDNSLSVKEVMDSIKLKKLDDEILSAKKEIIESGYEVVVRDLSGKEGSFAKASSSLSDLTTAIKRINEEYEGKNLSRIVLVSDGIYNAGVSPLYSPFRIPINAVGIGDSSHRKDIILKDLSYNKIAYQGNNFTLRAEIQAQDLVNKELNISVFQGGKKIAARREVATKALLQVDFQLPANQKGLQRIEVSVEPIVGEASTANNRATAYIEVVEGKKKIVVIAPAPHPDIKALRSVVERNSNYEFILFIPGISKIDEKLLQLSQADLIIFHQVLDKQNRTQSLLAKLSKGKSGVLYILGEQSNLTQLKANEIPLKFENVVQRDEVTASLNNNFRNFSFSETATTPIASYPPISVPFGKFFYPSAASVLMYQRIGSVVTDRPLVLTFDENERRAGVIIGEGFWQWRLNEYLDTEKTDAFDEVFAKLIQYLSTREDKRRFRSFPVSSEFTESESVVFESQVYNELFEPVFGNEVTLSIASDKGVATKYNYILSKDGARYKIGGLKEGVYKYKAAAVLNGKNEEVSGEFLVNAQTIETQNLTADFSLLQKLADNTGGKFYSASDLSSMVKELANVKAQSIIHSEDTFNPLINLKWVFFLLLALISAEWFLRKYQGSY
jgi:hypothetical protein